MGTNLSARDGEFDGSRFTRKATSAMAKNAMLNRWQLSIDDKIYEIERAKKTLSLLELKNEIEFIVKGERVNQKVFVDYIDEYIDSKKMRDSTRELYLLTKSKIEKYDPGCTFDSMDAKWMRRFEEWMAQTLRVNAYGIHLRNIRAVFNYCLDEEYTSCYPFRRFSIKKEETEKRCLTIEQVRALRDYPVEEYQQIYRDMWMLMFYLVGVNAADLFRAKKEQYRDGRLYYKRSKTGTLYSVKVEPEAKEIIERYIGEGEYLLSVMDSYKNYKDFLHRMNWNLQRIGICERKGLGGKKNIEAAFPGISSYWSRHTWATIAAEIDIPIEIISHALGHKIGSDVTAIYVKFNRMKVDEANRRVIDILNEKR